MNDHSQRPDGAAPTRESRELRIEWRDGTVETFVAAAELERLKHRREHQDRWHRNDQPCWDPRCEPHNTRAREVAAELARLREELREQVDRAEYLNNLCMHEQARAETAQAEAERASQYAGRTELECKRLREEAERFRAGADGLYRTSERQRAAAADLVERAETAEAEVRRLREERDQARRLLETAHHLATRGERAPGGTETWAQWHRDVETFLRAAFDGPAGGAE